uniref:Protein kinase 157785 isoform 2 n=1 Tax=Phytophthora sojae TaxID=67593 RepID=F4ZVE2_PHYSO|nr:protein kinase 157785 isoform 2 [Phytophthora sojae]
MAGDDNDNDNSEDDAPANTVELHPKRTTSFAARRKKKKNQPAVRSLLSSAPRLRDDISRSGAELGSLLRVHV